MLHVDLESFLFWSFPLPKSVGWYFWWDKGNQRILFSKKEKWRYISRYLHNWYYIPIRVSSPSIIISLVLGLQLHLKILQFLSLRKRNKQLVILECKTSSYQNNESYSFTQKNRDTLIVIHAPSLWISAFSLRGRFGIFSS